MQFEYHAISVEVDNIYWGTNDDYVDLDEENINPYANIIRGINSSSVDDIVFNEETNELTIAEGTYERYVDFDCVYFDSEYILANAGNATAIEITVYSTGTTQCALVPFSHTNSLETGQNWRAVPASPALIRTILM